MCGIAGIIGGVGDYSTHINSMIRAQAHRGPDAAGSVTYQGGAAGAVRLALVDLSERGEQPIWSPDHRVAILFNGEIYNHKPEHSRMLARGYPFRSTTDTEVILALYLEHGLDFVERLRGMFAIAILDWRDSKPHGRPSLILARDHFGIKPLYIARPNGPAGPLVFASEIRSLLASGLIERRINREALVDYLAMGFVVQPRSIIVGVEMLERGSVLRITPSGKTESRSFWRIPTPAPIRESFEDSAERLRSVLEESVSLHAMADAPVGAFLSGGVDSSGVVGLMAKKNPRLRTYTLRLTDFPESDEASEGIAHARALGCEASVLEVSGREIAQLIPRFAGELDQPSTDGLNTWLISRAAAKDVKGVLSGLGGDEWFSGYAATQNMARFASGSLALSRLVGKAARMVRSVIRSSYAQHRLEGFAAKAEPLTNWLDCRRVFGYQLAADLVGEEAGKHNTVGEIETLLEFHDPRWREESPVGLSCLLDVDVYMRSQLLRDSDATTMASSLELRVPLVDIRVAEFARSCADEFKLKPGGGDGSQYAESGAKRVLIAALRDVLPPNISNRPKRGFSLPYRHWLENELQELARETCSRKAIANRGLLDPDLASGVAWNKSAAKWLLWPLTWPLMTLELWCRAVIDRKESPISSSSPIHVFEDRAGITQ